MPMSSRQTIVFLGAPTSAEAMKTWHPPPLSPSSQPARLPTFQIDPEQRTQGPTWRRLTDPIDSLSQDLSQTSLLPISTSDPFLERSLQIYDHEGDSDTEMEQETSHHDTSESPFPQISPIPSPFLTGYDFDINEITELDEIPSAGWISARMSVSLIVAVREIGFREMVMTRFARRIELVKVIVGDQTKERFEVVCWGGIAILCQSLRVNDIVHFTGISTFPVILLSLQTSCLSVSLSRSVPYPSNLYSQPFSPLSIQTSYQHPDLGLSEFRGTVTASTRRKSRLTILYRSHRLSRGDDPFRPRLDLQDQQTVFVRRLRDCVVRGSWIQRDVPPALETQE